MGRDRSFSARACRKAPSDLTSTSSSGFRTPTGKVELLLSQADKFRVSPLPEFNGLPENPDPDFPLVLTSCKNRYYLHSSYRWVERLRRHRPHPKTEIHPETAARYGIHDGDAIIIETRKGVMSQGGSPMSLTKCTLALLTALMGGGSPRPKRLSFMIGSDPTTICLPQRKGWARLLELQTSRASDAGSGRPLDLREKNLINMV